MPAGKYAAPLWASAFRPFYLFGAIYGAILIAAWLGADGTPLPVPWPALSPAAWHGHEMIFGFSGAIIAGTVLTALPSWAGTKEITGGRLALLVALWAGGRFAWWLAPWLPIALVAALDTALFVVIAVMLTPQLRRAKNWPYLLLLPILVALYAGNVMFYVGQHGANAGLAALGTRLALWAIVVLYVLIGGLLTPIFTSNSLREQHQGTDIPFIFSLDVLATVSAVTLAAADLAALDARWVGLVAAVACAIHALRLARWRSWRVATAPLVFIMHVGYLWVVVAFGLKAGAAFGHALPETAWLHAFTVGSLGMMMLGLMTRVVLRHTGRPLALPPAIVLAYVLMFAAGVLRVTAALFDLGHFALTVSALLWVIPFLLYLVLFGSMLIRPSLPRTAGSRPRP